MIQDDIKLILELKGPNEADIQAKRIYTAGSEQFSRELHQCYFTNGTGDTTMFMNIHKRFSGDTVTNSGPCHERLHGH